jgi:hypothetical protein
VRTGGTALIKFRCRAASSCRGRLTISAERLLTHGRAKVRRTVLIGSARFSIPGGRIATVKVRLRSTGRALLAAAHRGLEGRLALLQLAPAPSRTKLNRIRLVQQAPGSTRR